MCSIQAVVRGLVLNSSAVLPFNSVWNDQDGVWGGGKLEGVGSGAGGREECEGGGRLYVCA